MKMLTAVIENRLSREVWTKDGRLVATCCENAACT